MKKCGFTIKVKTKEVLEGDEVQPNKLLVCDLGSMLATKKTIGMAMKKYNLIELFKKNYE